MWSYEQAWQRVKPGVLAPVYVLHGPEYALVRMFVERVCDAARETFGEVELHRFDFEEDGPDAAVAVCSVVGLFAAHHVVWLRAVHALAATPGRVRHDTSALENYLEAPNSEHILILSVDAEKLDDRRRLVKQAKAHVVVPCTTPGDGDAIRVFADRAAAMGVHIGRGALEELWRRSGSLSMAFTELDKLAVWCGEREVTLEDVRLLTPPPLEDNVFAWVDAVVSGRAELAFRTLEDVLKSGNDPTGLLALIERQIRLMALAKAAAQQGQSPKQAAARLGAHPYAVQVAMRQAQRLSPQQLEQWMVWAADAEYWVKSGRRDARHALEILVAQAAGLHQGRQGHRIR